MAVLTRTTVKRPPVAGTRAISPMEVEKVVRSSWANWWGCSVYEIGTQEKLNGGGDVQLLRGETEDERRPRVASS